MKYSNLIIYCYLFIFIFSNINKTSAQTNENQVVVFVNGFWGKQKFSPAKHNLQSYWQYDSVQLKPKENWNYNQYQMELFFQEVSHYFKTNNFIFVDGGNFSPYCSARKRQKRGFEFIENQINTDINKLILNKNSTINFITHSMGAAFAEGMIRALVKQNVRVGEVLHLAPSEASSINAIKQDNNPIKRVQIISLADKTVYLVNRWHWKGKNNLVKEMKNCDIFACFYESEITRPQAGDIGHALHLRHIVFDIIRDVENLVFCDNAQCVILENNTNRIPYKKICKQNQCIIYDEKKGYFIVK